jgi:hypothetical protein
VKTVQLYAPFEKVAHQPDGSLLVDFTVTSEAVDDQNEIVDYDAVKKAAANYMEWAALREMHQPSAVGTTLTLNPDDTLRKVTGQGRIVDPIAILKVVEGVYKGVSMGGRKVATSLEKVGAKTVRRVTELVWDELSLVDRPSNPDSYMTLAKREAAEKEPEMAAQKKKVQAADVAAAIAQDPAAPDAGLAKSAADDILSAHIITEGISRLIQVEAGDSDYSPEQIAALQSAFAAMQKFEGLEADELGTPEDTAEAEAEEAEEQAEEAAYAAAPVILAAAKTGNLRKTGARNAAQDQAVLDNILAEVLFLGAQPAAAPEAEAAPEPAPSIADAPPAPTDATAKMAGLSAASIARAVTDEFTRSAPFAKASDVSAIEERLLGLLTPMQEQLSKIAGTPMPGGPVRFATPGWAETAPRPVSDTVSAELAKMAEGTTDPRVREALQLQAAALDIRAAQSGK